MVRYEQLYKEIKQNLSEHRFRHTEGVIKRAIEYAQIYGVDIETVKLTALAHDIAKELTKEEENKYIKEYNIQFDEIEKINSSLHHAKIGAYICKYKYKFNDDMINSVRYHTTGRENMSLLEKIIYLADATEENRTYGAIKFIETIKEDIDEGMVQVSKWVINHLLENNKIIHLDSIKCYNYYIKKKNIENVT